MVNIYFSDFFDLGPDALESYGVFDVSLINDLPLFIDPFLLFNSSEATYRSLHSDIIKYMRFLRDVTQEGPVSKHLVDAWFTFSEVKQNWLGFSARGNRGHGLGRDFAHSLHRNFNAVFKDFGTETLTHGSHLEKLCLVRDGVGRDMISDFTTNLIKPFLGDLTQTIARECLPPSRRRKVSLSKAQFDYGARSWSPMTFELPYVNGDYVLLTPKDILTKDATWINRDELLGNFVEIADSVSDGVLRAQLNDYLRRALSRPKMTEDEVREAKAGAIDAFPAVLDYYILEKEAHGNDAASIARERVRLVERRFIDQVRTLVGDYLNPAGFYTLPHNTYDEAKRRLLFLKDVIENKGGHRIFYLQGKPLERESDLQILYRLTWFATPSDISREVNDGRGPADFKASRGANDKTLIEFKLAKNSQLARNLEKQAEIYQRASDGTHPPIKAIMYFTLEEKRRVQEILVRLGLQNSPHIVLINARSDDKPSGSKA